MTNEQIIRDITPEYSMTFNNTEGVVAKLNWSTGVMIAEGNLGYGAETLFDLLKLNIDSYIRHENKLLYSKLEQLERDLFLAKSQNSLYKSAVEDK